VAVQAAGQHGHHIVVDLSGAPQVSQIGCRSHNRAADSTAAEADPDHWASRCSVVVGECRNTSQA
jgi:hypothetical protein